MVTKIYQYPKCSTCRAAIKWLDAKKIRYEKHDLVANPLSEATLRDLLNRSGVPVTRFFNTSGVSYKTGKFRERLMTMTESQSLAALAKDGKLVKRPIVDTGMAVLVGFDEAAYTRKVR